MCKVDLPRRGGVVVGIKKFLIQGIPKSTKESEGVRPRQGVTHNNEHVLQYDNNWENLTWEWLGKPGADWKILKLNKKLRDYTDDKTFPIHIVTALNECNNKQDKG